MGSFLSAFSLCAVLFIFLGILIIISMRRISHSPSYQTYCRQIREMPTFETYRKLVCRSYIVDAVLVGIIILQLVTLIFLPIMYKPNESIFNNGSIFEYTIAMAKLASFMEVKMKEIYLSRLGYLCGIIVFEIGSLLAGLIYIIVRLGQGISEKEIYRRFTAWGFAKTPKKRPLSAPISFCFCEFVLAIMFVVLPKDIFSVSDDSIINFFSYYNLYYLITSIVVGVGVFICGIVFGVLENQAAKDFFTESGLIANKLPSA